MNDKLQLLQRMILDNESDTLNIDRRYQMVAVKMKCRMELRIERELLLEQLESLTGKANIEVDKLVAHLPAKPPKDEGPEEHDKEPVKK